MPAPLAIDIRRRVVEAYDSGKGSQEEIASIFGIARRSVMRWLKRRRETGSIEPEPHSGGRSAAYEGEKLEQLRQLVKERPDATLKELREQTGVDCSLVAVHNALKRLDLRYKKSR